jgi:pantoate--beta-alanine ligase
MAEQSPPSDRLVTVRTVAALRARIKPWREAGQSIGLVPTMGALHAGHLALVKMARAACERVIATIFVNPAQFGPSEDLSRYPRREADDMAAFADAGVELLFAPPVEEIYPQGFATKVSVAGPAEGLEGAHRPGHFEGVATVVAKLLIQALPDCAFFGEKDYQQLQVSRRMAADLDIRVLTALAAAVAGGGDPAAEAKKAEAALIAAGFARVDYVAVVDAVTLEPVTTHGERPSRALAAAFLGKTRLIDNVAIPPRG